MNYYYITGASHGIGKALAEALLKDPENKVVGISRTNKIKHKNYLHISIDLSKVSNVKRFRFEKIPQAKKIVLVNNAGTLADVKPFGKFNDNVAINGWILNVIAPGILMNQFMKTYKKTKAEKTIVNISSGAAKSAVDGWGVYCSSKAAMDMMTMVAAKEQEQMKGEFNILAIAPGIVDTQMQDKIREQSKKDFPEVERFIKYKENKELANPAITAEKLIAAIENAGKSKEHIFRLEY